MAKRRSTAVSRKAPAARRRKLHSGRGVRKEVIGAVAPALVDQAIKGIGSLFKGLFRKR